MAIDILQKWEKSGLLDGLTEKEKKLTAELLENQAQAILKEGGFGPISQPWEIVEQEITAKNATSNNKIQERIVDFMKFAKPILPIKF